MHVVIGLLLLFLLVSCASPDPTGSPAGDASTSPPMSSTRLPTMPPPTGPPTTPSDQRSPVTVAGRIEPGDPCPSLVADTGVTYLLTGPLADRLRPESTVKVRGLLLPERGSPCGSGIVLRVSQILPV